MKSWLSAVAVLVLCSLSSPAQDQDKARAEVGKLVELGRYRDALDLYEEKLMAVTDAKSGKDWEAAVSSVSGLGEWSGYDSLLDRALLAHQSDGMFLLSAGNVHAQVIHQGSMIAGKFVRGEVEEHKGMRVQTVRCDYRDRVRSLQFFRMALAAVKTDPLRAEAWAAIAMELPASNQEWKLQVLTPLDSLPEWNEPGPDGGTEGTPWAGDGPLLYHAPTSWDAAKNDGERWRFALAERARLAPAEAGRSILGRARLAVSQFGAPSANQLTPLPGPGNGWTNTDFLSPVDGTSVNGAPPDPNVSPDSLKDDECLAATSDGIRRFKLPPDQHFIALYRSILSDKLAGGDAGDELARVYLGRHQADRAEAVLRETLAKHGDDEGKSRSTLLGQITGAWGRFDGVENTATGARPKLQFTFRNATAVKFTAAPVDLEKLVRDIQSYVKSSRNGPDSDMINLSYLGERLAGGKEGKAEKYLGQVSATWQQDLKPLDRHRESSVEIETPIDQPGAWWVTARLAGGNVVHTLVWITDTVILQRKAGGNPRFFLTDAAAGTPIPGCPIEFFGYLMVETEGWFGRTNRVMKTKTFTRTTDADGTISIQPGELDPEYSWMEIARPAGRSVSLLAFGRFDSTNPGDDGENNKGYGISDRPLYKAGDTANLKFWLREVGYGKVNDGRWAGKTGRLVISDGRGEEVLKIEKLKTDAMGAVEVKAVLPKNAALGNWTARFEIPKQMAADVSFSVEEYRKPEYQVTVEAPGEPVKLGDKFSVTVRAAYFHGAPVRNATVEITVRRDSMGERWFPTWQWDWLYGKAAWWYFIPAPWHPGWSLWGCQPSGTGARWTPSELVMKRTVPIGEDGTAKLEIDTAPAKETHGDLDAFYRIQANVVDASRREERASGSVVAARKPFEVVVAADRGWARPGADVNVTLSAASLTGKPVAEAEGSLRLLRLETGKNGHIDEKEISTWPVKTDATGSVKQRFEAPAAGQYRLAAKLSVKGGPPVESAIIFDVFGSAKPGAGWHFGELELIPDKVSYAAGDTLKLRINSDHPDATVWLFLRAENDDCREVKKVVLDGRSGVAEIPLTRADMPNLFIQAFTVHGAELHEEMVQILLPPENRLLDVKIEPAKAKVKPRETSALQITIHDGDGKPFHGTATLAVYDKSLEAVTGGSNVGPIRENFWSWKRTCWYSGISDSFPSWNGSQVDQEAEQMMKLPGGGGSSAWALRSNSVFLGGGSIGYGAPLGPFGGVTRSGVPAASGTNVTNIITGGLRSGDVAINRNSIDAVLNNPNRSSSSQPAPLASTGLIGNGAAQAPLVQNGGGLTVRHQFADLLKWSGEVKTDADGKAEIPLEFPDNLTTWKARVWALGEGTRVGEGSAEIIASKDLLVRLEAPRFLVEKDEAVLSAVVHNEHDAPVSVAVSLDLEGGAVERIEGETKTVEIASKGEARVDWRVRAVKEGEATIRMKAAGSEDGDAMEKKLPVIVHGMLRQEAWSRVVDPGKPSATIEFEVPEQRRADQTKLTINFSPSVAGAVVDAIPYLAGYPYGCTEQTLDRFVGSVIGQKMVKDLGVGLDSVRQKRVNLNPQELGDAKDRAERWRQWQHNPVFDADETRRMVDAGTAKLAKMQNADGGWGWFSGFHEYSYPHTTAVVVHGLLVAKANGAAVPAEMIANGVAWLEASEKTESAGLKRHADRITSEKAGKKPKPSNRYEKQQADATDAFVRMILGEAGKSNPEMTGWLHRDRLKLPVYARCLLGLELHRTKDTTRRDEVMATISQFLKRDDENQTNHLDLQSENNRWYWYGSDVEANAWYLKLLTAVKPKAPETRGLVKYLVNNRRHGSWWNSTRDTAYAVEAIATWLKASGELAPKMEVEVLLDGKTLRKTSIEKENLFSFDGSVTVEAAGLATGKHIIELRRTGEGPLYANAYLEMFSLGDFLHKAGLEVKVDRHVYKLVKEEQQGVVPDSKGLVVSQREEKLHRQELKDGDTLASGDRVEVELVIESKNDYEYLLFSDAKGAGFEAVESLSGYVDGGIQAYMEPREKTVDFFIRSLPRGTSQVSYELRAEAPGKYHALPTTGEAMYAPELRTNSDEIRLNVGP